jgi:hypothetical protein
LGLVSDALELGQGLMSGKSPAIGPRLKHIWQQIYRIRTKLRGEHQELVRSNRESEFTGILASDEEKCQFLLCREPLLRRLEYDEEMVLDFDSVINEIVKFLSSDLQLGEIE